MARTATIYPHLVHMLLKNGLRTNFFEFLGAGLTKENNTDLVVFISGFCLSMTLENVRVCRLAHARAYTRTESREPQGTPSG